MSAEKRRVECPQCGAHLNVNANSTKSSFRCAKCGEVSPMPAEAETVEWSDLNDEFDYKPAAATTHTQPRTVSAPMSPHERAAILDRTLMGEASQGARIEARTENTAVVVTGKAVNHVLHLLLSVFLCSLWVPIWLIMAATGGERRATIVVDEYGRVNRRMMPMDAGRIILIVVLGVVWGGGFLLLLSSCVSAFSN